MLLPEVESLGSWRKPQCDKNVDAEFGIAHSIVSMTLETISNYRTAIRGSIVVVHEEPHPQMTGTLSYRPEERGGRQREKSLDTRHRRLDDRYRVLPWPEDARWWSVCTTPCTLCTFNACPSEKTFSVVPGNTGIGETMNGDELFTDESRFSLSSDSHRILSGREANHPSNIIERDSMEVAVFSFGEASCLVVVQTLTSSTQVQSTGSVIVTRFFSICASFRGAVGLQFLFMDDNAPCHRTVAAEQLFESEDIERMDWPAQCLDLNPIEHVWYFLGRRLAARTLPPVTIRELRLALQDEWAAMPQQLIDTLILSMGRRVKPF
ncbi:transposable element Tcb1 transposase [Trichonephila clavipes]|uniref:Transposable element Tcb1 transposase n=1 Tax=Trichonephila clavipes TaxID=2585209 RepID=A0A8X7BMN7_TRICX|nr:transposable element Tcb1 transposase [Trichonephila clavipes]